MTETNTEKFIQKMRELRELNMTPEMRELRKLNMTPEEIRHEKNRETAKDVGKVLGYFIVLLAEVTISWAILVFVFAVSVTWVQILGGFVLFNIIRSLIVKPYVK